ncbi:hypothetical protein LOAG_11535 [Loa loa]|uniref:Uncharacterized protein n=1 Tax=Loa loa TaxID=7209 RepID=A0A1S0TMY6_LOALO|nr:hypothetical protein LOAG_11535 [Loa loa]EFO16967.1 hypothetical protein LOAG_11535 [Loa loa]
MKKEKKKKPRPQGIPKTKGQRLQRMHDYFASRWHAVKRSLVALHLRKVEDW